ncbi:MAG: DUF2905 family protein [Caldithrix sp.]|nr:DUF2905 family protein [Caldithrix sp.]
MQRLLIILGLLILAAGLAWPLISKIPFGRMPGDIVISKPGIRIYIPLTTLISISILLSVIVWIVQKFK